LISERKVKATEMNTSKADQKESVQGNSIFIVETTACGISVQTGFLTEDGQLMQMPAIFPTQEYAMSQVEKLRQLVVKHFAEAALIGAQVIAQNNELSKSPSEPSSQGPKPEDTIQ
jgi:hypothetical protein